MSFVCLLSKGLLSAGLAFTLIGCAQPPPAIEVAAPIASSAELTEAAATTGAPSSAAVANASGACPEDMIDIELCCIDRFEAPNIAGEKPLRMQSADDGEAFCVRAGKRLCNEDEWLRACNGEGSRAFPYGEKYQASVCNDDGKYLAPSWSALAKWPAPPAITEVARLDQAEASGARPDCVSQEGVADLTGNVAEWVVRTKDNDTNYKHVVKGCFWGKCFRPPHTPSCEYVNFAHATGFRSYEMGFRCCSTPLGRMR